ncbi:MAG: hypothetical protein AAGJ40_14285 [Planctomycetota bacterium]
MSKFSSEQRDCQGVQRDLDDDDGLERSCLRRRYPRHAAHDQRISRHPSLAGDGDPTRPIILAVTSGIVDRVVV